MSYSSVLLSIPMCQAQLNRTDFRSVAPGSGVYGGSPPPKPWALDSDGRPIVSAATIATRVRIILLIEVIVISS